MSSRIAKAQAKQQLIHDLSSKEDVLAALKRELATVEQTIDAMRSNMRAATCTDKKIEFADNIDDLCDWSDMVCSAIERISEEMCEVSAEVRAM